MSFLRTQTLGGDLRPKRTKSKLVSNTKPSPHFIQSLNSAENRRPAKKPNYLKSKENFCSRCARRGLFGPTSEFEDAPAQRATGCGRHSPRKAALKESSNFQRVEEARECAANGRQQEEDDNDQVSTEDAEPDLSNRCQQTRRFYGVPVITRAPGFDEGREEILTPDVIEGEVLNSPMAREKLRPEKPLSPEREERSERRGARPESSEGPTAAVETKPLLADIKILTAKLASTEAHLAKRDKEAKEMKTLLDLLTSDVLTLRQELHKHKEDCLGNTPRHAESAKDENLPTKRWTPRATTLKSIRRSAESGLTEKVSEDNSISRRTPSCSPSVLQSALQSLKKNPSPALKELTERQGALTRRQRDSDPEELARQSLVPSAGDDASSGRSSCLKDGKNTKVGVEAVARSVEDQASKHAGDYSQYRNCRSKTSISLQRDIITASKPPKGITQDNISSSAIVSRHSATQPAVQISPPDAINQLEEQIETLNAQHLKAKDRLENLKQMTLSSGTSSMSRLGDEYLKEEVAKNNAIAEKRWSAKNPISRPEAIMANTNVRRSILETSIWPSFPTKPISPRVDSDESFEKPSPKEEATASLRANVVRSPMAVDFEEELLHLREQHSKARQLLNDMIKQTGIKTKNGGEEGSQRDEGNEPSWPLLNQETIYTDGNLPFGLRNNFQANMDAKRPVTSRYPLLNEAGLFYQQSKKVTSGCYPKSDASSELGEFRALPSEPEDTPNHEADKRVLGRI